MEMILIKFTLTNERFRAYRRILFGYYLSIINIILLSLTANFHEAGPLQRYSLCVVVQYFKCHKKDTENKRKKIFLSDYTAAFIFLGKENKAKIRVGLLSIVFR